jgi:hypothetical protein
MLAVGEASITGEGGVEVRDGVCMPTLALQAEPQVVDGGCHRLMAITKVLAITGQGAPVQEFCFVGAARGLRCARNCRSASRWSASASIKLPRSRSTNAEDVQA